MIAYCKALQILVLIFLIILDGPNMWSIFKTLVREKPDLKTNQADLATGS